MRKLWFLIIGFFFIVILVNALSTRLLKPNIPTNNKLQVTASFYPLYYFASQIGENKAEVINITPSGVEPHEYEPTAQELGRIENSDLLILNGGNLETWGNKIKSNLEGKNVTVITAAERLVNQDPHVWLSPTSAKEEVKAILEGYIKVDPKNKSYYQTNTNVLLQKLDQLDQEYKQGLFSCSRKDFITSHDAFGYLANTYGLNQVAISGISPDEEPSAQKLAEIADFAEKNNVKYIFFEKLVSPRLAETIANEVGAKTLVLDTIEGISNEDMKAGKNYFTIMKDNLNSLRFALECR